MDNNLDFDLNTINEPTYIVCKDKQVMLNFIQKFMNVKHTEKDLFNGGVLYYYNPSKGTHLKIKTMHYPTLGRYELFVEPTGLMLLGVTRPQPEYDDVFDLSKQTNCGEPGVYNIKYFPHGSGWDDKYSIYVAQEAIKDIKGHPNIGWDEFKSTSTVDENNQVTVTVTPSDKNNRLKGTLTIRVTVLKFAPYSLSSQMYVYNKWHYGDGVDTVIKVEEGVDLNTVAAELVQSALVNINIRPDLYKATIEHIKTEVTEDTITISPSEADPDEAYVVGTIVFTIQRVPVTTYDFLTFDFSIKGTTGRTGTSSTVLEISDIGEGWQLKRNKEVVASADFISDDIKVNLESTTTTITLPAIPNETFEYSLSGSSNQLKLINSDVMGEDIFYNITSFSKNINNYIFQLTGSSLTVPEHIPSNITDISNMFKDCEWFDQDISMWDTSNITNMEGTFHNCKTFNQDLSQWCVTRNSDKPDDFDTNAAKWVLPRPVWGTCPRGENIPLIT